MARSVWKGPFVDGYLLRKAEVARSQHQAQDSRPRAQRHGVPHGQGCMAWNGLWESPARSAVQQ